MKEENIKRLLLTLGIISTILVCLFPVLWMLFISFVSSPDFLINPKSFSLTLKNYTEILKNRELHFLDYLINSMVVSLVSSLFTTFISLLASYAITRFKFKWKLTFLIIVLSLSLFPPISIVGFLYKIATKLNWINTYQALIFPYSSWTLPFALWMLVSYMNQIPKELDNSAIIDGAGRLKILFKIIFPLMIPGVVATFLLVFIISFNEFLFALMLTTDHRARTIPVGIAMFEGLHGELPWGYIMAASTISIIPVVIIALLFQKHIIQGLTKGALKG